MVKIKKNESGFTLVELIVTTLVVAIIGASVVGIIIFFVQLFMYSPRQLDAQKIAQELENTIIEGNANIRGIRYAKTIIDASATQVSYTYGYPTNTDGQSVRFRWNAGDKHIYLSTSVDGGSSWSNEAEIPYYIPDAILIDGKTTPSVIFTYKKALDANWVSGTDPLSAIRRVIFSVSLKTGSGSFSSYQGSTNTTASAEVKGF